MNKKEAGAVLTLVSLGYTVKGPTTTTAPEPVGSLAQRMATVPGDDPAAPHGRDAGGNPLAPFGWLADGTRPRKTAAGRPKAAAPVAPAVAAPKPPAPAPVAAPAGLSLDLSDLGGAPEGAPAQLPEPESAGLDSLMVDLAKL